MTYLVCASCGQTYDSSRGCPTLCNRNLTHYSTPRAITTNTEEKLTTGIKHDQEKPDMSLLSPIALLKISEVMTFGKRKYSAHNWRGGFVWSRPASAAIRHIFAWLGGEDKDPETGLSHLAHASCCLMFLLEFETTRPDLDDRHKVDKK